MAAGAFWAQVDLCMSCLLNLLRDSMSAKRTVAGGEKEDVAEEPSEDQCVATKESSRAAVHGSAHRCCVVIVLS